MPAIRSARNTSPLSGNQLRNGKILFREVDMASFWSRLMREVSDIYNITSSHPLLRLQYSASSPNDGGGGCGHGFLKKDRSHISIL
jgi:hypothetical protein